MATATQTTSIDDLAKECENKIVLAFIGQDYAVIPALTRKLRELTARTLCNVPSAGYLDERIRDLREIAVVKVFQDAKDYAATGRYDPLGKKPLYLPFYERAVEISEKDVPGTIVDSNHYRWLRAQRNALEKTCDEAQ